MLITILSASQGQGKTTYLREQLAILRKRGISLGGILAPAIFDGGQRIGYDLVDLGGGDRMRLARYADTLGVAPTVGPFWLDPAALAAGNAAIAGAVHDGVAVIAIDEIGPLELNGAGWASGLELALRECSPAQSLIITVRPTVTDQLPAAFASPAWQAARRVISPWPDVLSIQ